MKKQPPASPPKTLSTEPTARPPSQQWEPPPTFAAIDFETCHTDRDSACALAVIRVDAGKITRREVRLIHPPRRERFMFTEIHGLRFSDVASAPRFAQLWPVFRPLLEGVDFIAAHNAPFDKGVLEASLLRAGLPPPEAAFLCTVQLARRVFKIFPTKLNLVCQRLEIPLVHHDPASDAEASAQIVLQAAATGATLSPTHRPIRLDARSAG